MNNSGNPNFINPNNWGMGQGQGRPPCNCNQEIRRLENRIFNLEREVNRLRSRVNRIENNLPIATPFRDDNYTSSSDYSSSNYNMM